MTDVHGQIEAGGRAADVSAQSLAFLVNEAFATGMSPDEILVGTNCEFHEIQAQRGWIDWPSFSRILLNIHARIGDAGFIEFGHKVFQSSYSRHTVIGFKLIRSPGEFYSWGIEGQLAKLYPCARFEGNWPRSDFFTMNMVLREGYAPCRPLMFAFEGQCQRSVELCGLDSSQVYARATEGGFELGMPSPRRLSLRRRIALRLGARSALRDAADNVGDLRTELLGKLHVLDAEVQHRKAAQAALEKEIVKREALAEQVAQIQRLRSVALLAGGVAHDFNNILMVIRGNAEFALDSTSAGDNEEVETNLVEIISAAERGTRLTRKLLTAGRRQVIEPTALELEGTIVDMLPLLTKLARQSKVGLEFIPQAEPAMIRADPGQIEQILLNLVVNARDASSLDERITIETDMLEIDADYVETNPWAKPGRYALLRVSDHGTGMSPEVRKRLFDPFFTTKPMGSGTGLGMSVVMGAVKQHEGLIKVYSEVGVGTAISIYLPLHAGESGASPCSLPIERAPGGHETVLLVDDDPPVREVAATVLAAAGYEVVSAECSDGALAILRERGEDLALGIFDVVLPGRSGPELAALAHRLWPKLPILYTSGYSAQGIHGGFSIDASVNYLAKPYGGQQLLWRVRRAIDRAHAGAGDEHTD